MVTREMSSTSSKTDIQQMAFAVTRNAFESKDYQSALSLSNETLKFLEEGGKFSENEADHERILYAWLANTGSMLNRMYAEAKNTASSEERKLLHHEVAKTAEDIVKFMRKSDWTNSSKSQRANFIRWFTEALATYGDGRQIKYAESTRALLARTELAEVSKLSRKDTIVS